MIAVVATIETKPGRRAALLEVFEKLTPQVLAEQGCIEYAPMIDFAVSLPGQPPPRENAVTVLEKWESIEALEAHLMTPHMIAFRKATESLRAETKLQLLVTG
ncbi:MAG: antibiotic biosynthesis monooxygenase [Pirellulales bacterium]|nr:antibiotic biosynthesis monooxygenase [Pirellulales bacterium]